ncbi:MAG: transcriptional repressor [Planctomycetota bacterium]
MAKLLDNEAAGEPVGSVSAAPAEPAFVPPLCAVFRRFLKRQGLKFTTERALILDAVLSRDGVFEADALVQDLRHADGRVSKATVYRTLKHLTESNIIQEELIDSQRSHYRVAYGRGPVGHLACVETREVVEAPAEELEAIARRWCDEHGYEFVSHRFVVYGVSPEAQKQEQAEAGDEA